MTDSKRLDEQAGPTAGPVPHSGHLETLVEISRVVSATLDLRTLYDTIHEQVGRMMDTTIFFVALRRSGAGGIDLTYLRESDRLYLNEVVPETGSVTGLVLERGTPLLFPTDAEYRAYADMNDVATVHVGDHSQSPGEAKIYVPLNTDSRTIGVLSVQSMRTNAYTRDDVRVLSVIASQAAVAIENARLYSGSREAVHQMQTLLRVAETVNGSLELRRVLDGVLAGIREVVPYYFAAILLPDSSNDYLDIVGVAGPPETQKRTEAMRQSVRIPLGEGVTGTVFRTGQPLVVPDVRQYPGYLGHGIEDVRSEIAVPLKRGDSVIGVLDIERSEAPVDSESPFSPDELNLLSLFASQATTAIQNARSYAQSQDMVRQTRTLLHIAQLVNGSLDLQQVLDAILLGIRDVLPYYMAAILLPDHERHQLDIVGSRGHLAEERRRTLKIPFGKGVTGQVFVTNEPIIVPDVDAFPGYIPVDGVRSEMAVPLCRGHAVIGVLDVERGVEGPSIGFSPAESELLTLFASQAAIAIENARLFTEEQRRVVELQVVQSIVEKMTRLHDARSIASLIDGELRQLIEFGACRLFLVDGGDLRLIPSAHDAVDAGENESRDEVSDDKMSGWVASRAHRLLEPASLYGLRAERISDTLGEDESLIAAPLAYEGSVRGIITLWRSGAQPFDDDALRLLEIIAAQAAIALDRCRLYKELRIQAVTDELTGLYNRRYLLERFGEERARALHHDHPLAVILLDIDGFKQVNDAYGHDAGDGVLRELAGVIRAEVRAEDIVFRYGGEEFCIVLPEISTVDAENVANRLRHIIAHSRLPDVPESQRVTASIGLAFLQPDDTGAEVITRADRAMYELKRSGGDGLSVSGPHRLRCLDRGTQSGITAASA